MMGVLSVNLKHLYQRRRLWLIYVVLGVVAATLLGDFLVNPRAGEGDFIWFAMLPFFIGFLAILPQMEVLSKPLSYCLPGHRRVLRRYVFCTAIATSAVCSMLFLRYPDLHGGPLLLVVCSAFFAGLTFYMAGVLLAMAGVVPAMIGMNAVVLLFLWAQIGSGKHFDLHVLLERIIIGNVFVVVFLGILSSTVMWLWLGRAGLARRYCAVSRIGFGFIDVFTTEKRKRNGNACAETRQKIFKKHPRPWVSKWFLGRMERYDYCGPERFFWGSLYCTFGTAVSVWRWLLLLTLLLASMLGYMGQIGMFMLIMMYAMQAMDRQPPVYSTMLISGGRRRRLTTSLGLTVTDASLLCMGILVVRGLSVLFARFMPTVVLEGQTFDFRPIDPLVAIVPFILVPFVSTMQLVFYGMPFLRFGTLLLPVYVAMFLFLACREYVEPLVTPLYVLSLMVVSWSVFLLVLRRVCSKWCLVGGKGRI